MAYTFVLTLSLGPALCFLDIVAAMEDSQWHDEQVFCEDHADTYDGYGAYYMDEGEDSSRRRRLELRSGPPFAQGVRQLINNNKHIAGAIRCIVFKVVQVC